MLLKKLVTVESVSVGQTQYGEKYNFAQIFGIWSIKTLPCVALPDIVWPTAAKRQPRARFAGKRCGPFSTLNKFAPVGLPGCVAPFYVPLRSNKAGGTQAITE